MAKLINLPRLPKSKIFIMAFLGVLACWVSDIQDVMAAMSGKCSRCHTMHDSQNGEEYPGGSSGPQEMLLVGSCVACHTGDNPGDQPFVLASSEPALWDATLAGGNFWWVDQADGDAKGHNVVGIAGEDSNIGLTPPGWSSNAEYHDNVDRSSIGGAWGSQLTCADGVTGCHGTAEGGIQGSHHDSNNTESGQWSGNADASSLGDDFRFLYNIIGYEAADFGLGGDTGDYNIYEGQNRHGGSGLASDADTNTISYFCAGCHGEFHSADGVGGSNTGVAPDPSDYTSPWIRHPIDIALSDVAGDYAASYDSYNPKVPLAYDTAEGTTTIAGDADSGTVTCLSCHFAHGGPYDDLLRWDYANYTVGDSDHIGEGCFQCHGNKDSD